MVAISEKCLFRHFSLIATMYLLSGSDWRLIFLAFDPNCKLEKDMTDDRSAAAPFVTHLFQVAEHSIATLDMIVRANFAATG